MTRWPLRSVFDRSEITSIAPPIGHAIAPSNDFERPSIGLLRSPYNPLTDGSALARAFHPASNDAPLTLRLRSNPLDRT